MTQVLADSTSLWILIGTIGVGTFALRLSFIQMYAWLDEVPPQIEQALQFIPVAVLSALILPALVSFDGSFVGALVNARLFAGIVAWLVAWRTKNMMATIGVGMGVLWAAQLLLG